MKNKTHVLIVEDETIIAMDIQQCLEEYDYVVDEVATNISEAIFYINKYRPDVVLMDIKLQDCDDGTTIVENIQKKYQIPVIYLTSHSDEKTLKKAQETKPYGYIIKPVDEKQLNSSIRIALSKFDEEKKLARGEVLEISDIYLYIVKKSELYCLGEKIDLGKKEALLFKILMANINKSVLYENIIKKIWDNEVPVSTLRSLVRRIREKLEENIIENVSSKGYIIRSRS